MHNYAELLIKYTWLDILHRSCIRSYTSCMHECSSHISCVTVIITHTPYKPNKITLK